MIASALRRLEPLRTPVLTLRALRSPIDRSTPEGRARERLRRLTLSAGASAAAKLITIATSLISIPLTLQYLGAEQYGIWLVITSFTVMLSFADMGLGNGILNAVAKAHGLGDRRAIREIVSSGYAMLIGIALVLLTGFAIAYHHVPWYRLVNATTPGARAAAGPALAVFVACFVATIPGSVAQKVQIGLQQGFINSLWQALGSLFGLIAVLVVIWMKGSLAMLVAALTGAPLFALMLNTLVFFRHEGADLRPTIGSISKRSMFATSRTGGMFFFIQLIGAVAFGADTIILAQIAGSAMVAQYAVPERMFAIISMVVAMALAPLWPAYGEAIARGDREWVGKTLRRSLLISACVSAALSLLLLVFGNVLIRLWVGNAIQPTFFLLLGLGVWRVVEACGNAIAFYMNGVNMMRSQVAIGAVAAATKILLKIALVSAWGPAGLPWGGVIAFVLTAGLPYFFLIRRQLRTFDSHA